MIAVVSAQAKLRTMGGERPRGSLVRRSIRLPDSCPEDPEGRWKLMGAEGGGGLAFVLPSPPLSKLGMMCRTPRNTPISDDSEEHLQNKSLWHRDSASLKHACLHKKKKNIQRSLTPASKKGVLS